MEPRLCRFCGKALVRKIFTTGNREAATKFKRRKYCNQYCANWGRHKGRSLERTEVKRQRSAAYEVQQAPQRPTICPQTSSKPKPRVVAPSKPLERITQPSVNRPLPDPRQKSWATIAPVVPSSPCPKHPSESAAFCTLCNLKPRHQSRKVGDATPVWRRT